MRMRWAYGLFTSRVGSAAIVRYCLASQQVGTDSGRTLRQIAMTATATNRATSTCLAFGRSNGLGGSTGVRRAEASPFETCCVGSVLAPRPVLDSPGQVGNLLAHASRILAERQGAPETLGDLATDRYG